MNIIFIRAFLMVVFMGESRDILIVINYPDDKNELKELENIKDKIIIKILRERYGDKILEQYINSMMGTVDDYSLKNNAKF